jgi:hypothetical protein
VQEYSISFEDESNSFRFCTHLGTDYGPVGTGKSQISWRQGEGSGEVCVDLASGAGAGMWHSLAGLAEEKDRYLDFLKCYPYIRDEFQARCVGMTVRVRGSGFLKLELQSPEKLVVWWATETLSQGDEWQELAYSWAPADLRRVKFLNWAAETGAQLCVDYVRLRIEVSPDVSFEQRVFLVSYAKLARCYSPGDGTVRERADRRAGLSESIPATGLFCLATCAAWKMGVVKRASAEQILRKIHAVVSGLPRAKGLLPHFIQKHGGKYEIRGGAEYSTIATSLYYHGMFLAAQMLWDAETLASLTAAMREIDFDQFRDSEGYVLHGVKDDGQTSLAAPWREWGGETALVLLLERMAMGDGAKLKMDRSGTVRDGVGFIAEIQSLFYPDFSSEDPDAVTGANWLKARRALLEEQRKYFPSRWPRSIAARAGLYGLSAGEGPRGVGYVINGTRSRERAELIHPHYVLMSGLLESSPNAVYDVLRVMEKHGLLPPWGMVENFTKDLTTYLPMLGSLNGAFECISAYHLWAKETRERDHIYEAAEDCAVLWEAVRAFYPRTKLW